MHDALGDAKTVVNVGAGAGSYEPADRHVIAIEPSRSMRSQRPADKVPAIDAVAEQLPLDDDSVDAAMAMITIHQWTDTEAGLRELRRVARDRVVVLAFDGDAFDQFWLAEYRAGSWDRGRAPPRPEDRLGLRGASPARCRPCTRVPIPDRLRRRLHRSVLRQARGDHSRSGGAPRPVGLELRPGGRDRSVPESPRGRSGEWGVWTQPVRAVSGRSPSSSARCG